VDTKLHIEIFGRQYTLRGQSDQSYADELVALVNKKMREISKHSPGINIAHELVQAENETKVTQTALNGKTQEMIKNIETILKTASPE